jgi:hypothetical protein
MKYAIIFAAVLCAVAPAFADDMVVPESNRGDRIGPLVHGRWEILFSPIARADTFLLDTETGRTWQLVVNKHSAPLWQEVTKE